MPDFIDRIGSELARAAAVELNGELRSPRDPRRRPSPAASKRPRARRPTRAAALLAALVLGAGSAAAAVSLSQESAPPSGAVPASSVAALAFAHYSFEVFPQIEAGQAGWCAWVYSVVAGTKLGGGGSCGPGASGTGTEAPGSPGRGASFVWVMVPGQVAAVRTAERRLIETVADPRLPLGFRVAVAFAQSSAAFEPMTPLDAHGRSLSIAGLNHSLPPAGSALGVAPTVYWRWPQAPPRGGCALRAAPGTGLHEQWGRVVRHVSPASGVPAGTFLSCASLWLSFRGRQFYAALLLDAIHPGVFPNALPELVPVSGHPGVYHRELPRREIAVNSIQPLVARRAGPGWLVVEGDTTLVRRLSVLSALSGAVKLPAARR
jgi:hypothetical protein